MIFIEGIIWYLFLLDCLIYAFMVFTKDKVHNKVSHWVSKHFPLNIFFAIYYLIIVGWLGFALYRLGLLGF